MRNIFPRSRVKVIRAILAHDAMWGIGKDGDLPWPHNPEDLKWFKESTADGVVVMGRKTWESLPRKPLPNRTNVVISSSPADGADISLSGDLTSSLDYVEGLFEKSEIWIIGGAQLLKSSLERIDELWLNNVGGNYDCDTFLPKMEITRDFYATNTEVKSFGIVTIWSRR